MTQQQLDQLRAIAALQPALFLMGGFAEDALLYGRVTRERGDIDLLVERATWERASRQLESAGVTGFEAAVFAPDGEPLAFKSASGCGKVEVWLADDFDGRVLLWLPAEPPDAVPAYVGLELPTDTFDYWGAVLSDIAAPIVSPLALYLLRATSALTRGNAERRAVDDEVAEHIARHSLSTMDLQALVPKLRPWSNVSNR